MRLRHRIHEWLADNTNWVQYPVIRPIPPGRRVIRRHKAWRDLVWREKGWRVFWIFWGGVLLLSIYGNLIR